jgi:hypothetical protein
MRTHPGRISLGHRHNGVIMRYKDVQVVDGTRLLVSRGSVVLFREGVESVPRQACVMAGTRHLGCSFRCSRYMRLDQTRKMRSSTRVRGCP